jgi:hypothetical protein
MDPIQVNGSNPSEWIRADMYNPKKTFFSFQRLSVILPWHSRCPCFFLPLSLTCKVKLVVVPGKLFQPRPIFNKARTYQRSLHLVPISPTFYEQLLRQNPFTKKLPTQIVSTLKLCKELWYDCQFHQYFTSSFFIPKFFAHLLCA